MYDPYRYFLVDRLHYFRAQCLVENATTFFASVLDYCLKYNPSLCQNGGRCIPTEDQSNMACLCPAGWTGDLCDRGKILTK